MNLPRIAFGEAFTPKLVTAFREGYGRANLRADALAGLTVAIVALPLAMALGIASGASPREGLVTAIIAGFLISALGGSRVQIGGPTGAFVVIVAGVIAAHGFDGLVLATLMAGVILIIAGYDRFVALLRTDAGERGVLVLTFLLTIFVDLTVAIGVGVTLAALLFMMRMSETAGLVPIDVAEDPKLRDQLPEGVEVFRFTGPLFFGVASEMLEALRRSGQRPKAIILRMERVPYVDATGANALATFTRQAKHSGTEVWVVGLQQQPREFLGKFEPRFAGARRASSWAAGLRRLKQAT